MQVFDVFRATINRRPRLSAIARRIKNYAVRSAVLLKNIGPASGDVLKFQCNICGSRCRAATTALGRETPSCAGCGSTVRMRAIIHVLSTELFGKSLAIAEFPRLPGIKGAGMSDWNGYAVRLGKKFGYRNTFYHCEPKLDITSIDRSLEGSLDFLISSDVFEHVNPPVTQAFANARRLLSRDGVMVFTVPYRKSGATVEHFPELHEYRILKESGEYILKNRTATGEEQVYRNLVFHGGPGATLELRSFSEPSLLEEFERAGFGYVKIYDEPCQEFGIVWENDWSLPIASRVCGPGKERQ
jgi:SAM-dependent methyltransferase